MSNFDFSKKLSRKNLIFDTSYEGTLFVPFLINFKKFPTLCSILPNYSYNKENNDNDYK